MNGLINVDKPIGFTSFDVIRKLKKILNMKKIGHTGTLDPLATGVLVICLGRATKLANVIEATKKTYIADFILGSKTDTYDTEGEIIEKSEIRVSKIDVEQILGQFRGEIKQVPPMYSALKVNGKRLYELAREGVVIERKSREVTISKLELLEFDEETQCGKLYCEVSKGTYIRSLIFDIGEELKTFAHMTGLRRTEVGEYKVEDGFTIEDMEKMGLEEDFSFVKSVEESFPFEKVELKKEKDIKLYINGNTIVCDKPNDRYKIYEKNKFIGLGEVIDKRLKGWKVF
ncbi:MAG: tRNA pseudouridine(55) synthase TruB [Psychrilyobacter sp.]|nr:tRNA pseudouridine(55) synthase TruB [Psychrilyobacter sp.]